MVYGESKVAGFVLGTSMQGLALGFLLTVTLAMGGVQDGLGVIGYALTMTMLATLAMLAYVSIEKHEFSLIRAGLSMLFIPMLVLMGLQLVFPIGGTLGIVVSAVFLVVSVAGMLWKLNFVVHEMPTSQGIEGGFEITLGVIVLFWNLLSLMNRLRRR
jgi:FtsH-binding integral membrane protein